MWENITAQINAATKVEQRSNQNENNERLVGFYFFFFVIHLKNRSMNRDEKRSEANLGQ